MVNLKHTTLYNHILAFLAVCLISIPVAVSAQEFELESVRYRSFLFPDREAGVLESTDYEILDFDFREMATLFNSSSLAANGDYVFLTAFLSISDSTDILDLGTVEAVTQVREILQPYFYPSPFRLSEGSELGYELPDDMDIEIRIYNMAGNEIYREFFVAGTNGGLGHHGHRDYNKIAFTRESFGGEDLSAGIYFFVLIHDGKVFSKGKFAVRP